MPGDHRLMMWFECTTKATPTSNNGGHGRCVTQGSQDCEPGIMYGMGRKKLAGTLDITEEDAKGLLNKYHDKVPFVKGMADLAMNWADKGVIRTWLDVSAVNLWEPRSYGYNRALPLEDAVKEYVAR